MTRVVTLACTWRDRSAVLRYPKGEGTISPYAKEVTPLLSNPAYVGCTA